MNRQNQHTPSPLLLYPAQKQLPPRGYPKFELPVLPCEALVPALTHRKRSLTLSEEPHPNVYGNIDVSVQFTNESDISPYLFSQPSLPSSASTYGSASTAATPVADLPPMDLEGPTFRRGHRRTRTAGDIPTSSLGKYSFQSSDPSLTTAPPRRPSLSTTNSHEGYWPRYQVY